MSYNKVLLIGRLTADPELRRTQSGKAVASFTLAVDRYGTEKQADFIGCVAWEKTAESICNYFRKGKEILVEGDLQTRKYEDRDGNKRTATEVIVRAFRFVGKKEESAMQQYGTSTAYENLESSDADLPF